MSLSQDKTTKPHRSQEGLSSMASCKFSGTTLTCTPSTTQKADPQVVHPWPMWTSYSRSKTPRYSWPPSQNLTSLGCCERQHHTNHIWGHRPQILTTAHAHQPLKSWKNPGSYPETTGIATSRDWHHNIRTPSWDWEEGWWKPLSIGTTFSPITLNFFCHMAATAPVTRVHLGQGKTPTPDESSPVRRPTPSSWEKHSPQWSTSPSGKRETKPCTPKYRGSGMLTTGLGIWPRIWPISRSYTTIQDRRSTIPCMPSSISTPSAASSHASSMMPRRPWISHKPYSMLASTTSQMGRNMAPSSTINRVSSAKGTDTSRAIARTSINACSVTEQGTKSNYAAFLTKGAKQEGYATSLTTTPGWPIYTALRTLGPSDGEKDVNKGIMS
jgi:hypothetical protein